MILVTIGVTKNDYRQLFVKINSYTIPKRNGKDAILLIDYGLINDAFQEYYAKR